MPDLLEVAVPRNEQFAIATVGTPQAPTVHPGWLGARKRLVTDGGLEVLAGARSHLQAGPEPHSLNLPLSLSSSVPWARWPLKGAPHAFGTRSARP